MTTYYIQRLPNEEEKRNLEILLKTDDYEQLENEISKFFAKVPFAYTTAGWQTAFYSNEAAWDMVEARHADTEWKDNLESLKEVLQKKNIHIEDEYGTKYTYKAFWNRVKDSLYANENLLNRHTNLVQSPYRIPDDWEYIDKDGIRWELSTLRGC